MATVAEAGSAPRPGAAPLEKVSPELLSCERGSAQAEHRAGDHVVPRAASGLELKCDVYVLRLHLVAPFPHSHPGEN